MDILEWTPTDDLKGIEKCVITVDYKNRNLSVMDKDYQGDRKVIGPYLAMYNYRYREFKWVNWDLCVEPTLELLQSLVEDKGWEDYVFSLIVSGHMGYDKIREIVDSIGYVPDYILRRQTGKVTLLHQTNSIERLVKEGYTLTENNVECPNYSFGMGLYCLDKELHDECGTNWGKEPNVFTGHYVGEYLRCIDDTCNGLKGGERLKYQQEILVPFNEKEIRWELK